MRSRQTIGKVRTADVAASPARRAGSIGRVAFSACGPFVALQPTASRALRGSDCESTRHGFARPGLVGRRAPFVPSDSTADAARIWQARRFFFGPAVFGSEGLADELLGFR